MSRNTKFKCGPPTESQGMKKSIQICKECAHTYDDCDCAEDDGTPIRQRGGARKGAGSRQMNMKTQKKAVVLHRVRRDLWNKCDACGRVIPYADIESGKAIHNMKTPDSEVSFETWETLCRDHYQPNVNVMALPDKTPN